MTCSVCGSDNVTVQAVNEKKGTKGYAVCQSCGAVKKSKK